MNDPLGIALIGVVGIVLGVVVAWGLSLLQEWLHQRQVRQRVRLLLRLECKQNLTALYEFWSFVSRTMVFLPEKGTLGGVGLSPSEHGFDQRQRLAVWPLPVWGRLMWESQAGSVATALDADEIDRVYRLYSDLETFAARRDELREQFATSEGKLLSTRYSNWMQGKEARRNPGDDAPALDGALRDFINKTAPEWNECEAVYNRAMQYKDSDIIAP